MNSTTIIADASFCPETHVGGYAYWIANERRKFGGDGRMRVKPTNNVAAECIALLEGLKSAIEAGVVGHRSAVLLETDCQPAIDTLSGRRPVSNDQERRLVDWFDRVCARHSLRVRYKHVKGHTKQVGNRFVVNAICDRKARKHMRRARNEHARDVCLASIGQ